MEGKLLNILYINTHDTGKYIEPYGYPVGTPNISKLGNTGIIFNNAFCAAPTCSPSRAGMLTGTSPHSCGMLGLTHRGFKLNNAEMHLANYLQKNNFETVLCGIQHESENVTELGYEKILHKEEERGKEWDIKNANLVASYLKENNSKPFFASFGMFNTHRKFADVKEEFDFNQVILPAGIPEDPSTKMDMAGFISSLEVVDQCVGIVMKALEESGKIDDTMVIFTTDHGIPFPKKKCSLYDDGIGISLIIKFPQKLRNGFVCNHLVSQIDIFPTICDLIGQERPSWLQGVSILPLLSEDTHGIRREIFSEINYHVAYEPMRCIRTERYKLIKSFEPERFLITENIDDGLTKDFMLEKGLLSQYQENEILFDLKLDQNESINLVNNEEYSDIYSDLNKRLEKWMTETNDPLLFGSISTPMGANIIPRDKLKNYNKEW